MAQKLWQGGFKGAADEVISFNSSENAALDRNLISYDILGSIAHVRMLERQGIIGSKDASAINEALKRILADFDCGKFKLDPALEDVHTNVEKAVTDITPAGKMMHTARSRNDQVLLDMRMYLRDEAIIAGKAIIAVREAFARLSRNEGPMVGYTHTRVAQPITISFWCQAHANSLERDLERISGCLSRINQSPLGAGAIAGTGWKIDRKLTAGLLAFDSVQENELDAISSRGEAEAELLGALSLVMVKLSGISEELIWLSQKGLARLPDSFCTGSSMMPNKRNPDVLELIRARSARVHASLFHVLSVKKGLISGYHSDMQETKYAVIAGLSCAKACFHMMALVVEGLAFDRKRIEEELESGYAQATEIADALSRKGVPFREAHGIIGKLVTDCQAKGITLRQAGRIPELNEAEWALAISLERPRLIRTVKIDGSAGKAFYRMERRIAKAYEALLS